MMCVGVLTEIKGFTSYDMGVLAEAYIAIWGIFGMGKPSRFDRYRSRGRGMGRSDFDFSPMGLMEKG